MALFHSHGDADGYLPDEEQPWYDVMQVCENGHKITAFGRSSAEDLVARCPDCGAPTATSCKHCRAEIRGYKHEPLVASPDDTTPPDFCHRCGAPFPWKGRLKEKPAQSEPTVAERIGRLLNRFHLLACQLRKRYNNRPTLDVEDEYDVQDLLHVLLKIEFDDIRPEEWTPSYAGRSSRMDFLLKNERVVIEVKRTGHSLGSKQVGDQLIVDVERYSRHPDCKSLICFVYDPDGRIGNPTGMINDLESKSTKTLAVRVFIAPNA